MTAIGGGSNAPCCDGLRILGPRMEGVSQDVTGSWHKYGDMISLALKKID